MAGPGTSQNRQDKSKSQSTSHGSKPELTAIGLGVSDSSIRIVVLGPGIPPKVARTVALTEILSDIRLELQLNELLRSLSTDALTLPVGIGFQSTTAEDTRNLQWLRQACDRLKLRVQEVQPLAQCIEHVEVGGNPHPVLHGAIGAALMASAPAEVTDKPKPSRDAEPAAAVSEVLLARIRQLEETVAAMDERDDPTEDLDDVAAPSQIELTDDTTEAADDTPSARPSLDARIAELADTPILTPDADTRSDRPDADTRSDRPDAVAALLRELTVERDAADASAAKIDELVRRLDAHRDSADARAEEVERLNTLIDETKQRLEDASDEGRIVRRRIVELEVRNARLTEELHEAKEHELRTEKRFAQVAARNEKLEARADDVAEYQVEVFRLNAKLSIIEDKLDAERKKTRAAIAKATQLRHELVTATPRPRHESRASRRVG